MNVKRLQALRAAKGYHLLPVRPGMQLELHEEVGDESNKRIWRFKGLVIKVQKPNHADGTFTIRGKTAGHTIEKIYPISFPNFKQVMLLDEYKIRRAKLYYIRDKVGKDARMSSILGKDDKNIDLLALAVEEAEALKKAYDEANKAEEKDDSQTVVENSETVDETGATEENKAEDMEDVKDTVDIPEEKVEEAEEKTEE